MPQERILGIKKGTILYKIKGRKKGTKNGKKLGKIKCTKTS